MGKGCTETRIENQCVGSSILPLAASIKAGPRGLTSFGAFALRRSLVTGSVWVFVIGSLRVPLSAGAELLPAGFRSGEAFGHLIRSSLDRQWGNV